MTVGTCPAAQLARLRTVAMTRRTRRRREAGTVLRHRCGPRDHRFAVIRAAILYDSNPLRKAMRKLRRAVACAARRSTLRCRQIGPMTRGRTFHCRLLMNRPPFQLRSACDIGSMPLRKRRPRVVGKRERCHAVRRGHLQDVIRRMRHAAMTRIARHTGRAPLQIASVTDPARRNGARLRRAAGRNRRRRDCRAMPRVRLPIGCLMPIWIRVVTGVT